MARTKDPILGAKKVFDHIIAKYDPESLAQKAPVVQLKEPTAQADGKLGGLKGGKARATRLSSSKRKAIASKAAKIRWSKKTE